MRVSASSPPGTGPARPPPGTEMNPVSKRVTEPSRSGRSRCRKSGLAVIAARGAGDRLGLPKSTLRHRTDTKGRALASAGPGGARFAVCPADNTWLSPFALQLPRSRRTPRSTSCSTSDVRRCSARHRAAAGDGTLIGAEIVRSLRTEVDQFDVLTRRLFRSDVRLLEPSRLTSTPETCLIPFGIYV
jgi:hypothetical protein